MYFTIYNTLHIILHYLILYNFGTLVNRITWYRAIDPLFTLEQLLYTHIHAHTLIFTHIHVQCVAHTLIFTHTNALFLYIDGDFDNNYFMALYVFYGRFIITHIISLIASLCVCIVFGSIIGVSGIWTSIITSQECADETTINNEVDTCR